MDRYLLFIVRILCLWNLSSDYGTYLLLMEPILCVRNVSSAYGTYPLITEHIFCLWNLSSAYGTYPLFMVRISPLSLKSRLKLGNACYYSVQNLLSSRLLSKNFKIKINRTIILPMDLYGCETWSLPIGRTQDEVVS